MPKETDTRPPQLVQAYLHSCFDPLVARDLLSDEVSQRRETGYDVDAIVIEANATDPRTSTRFYNWSTAWRAAIGRGTTGLNPKSLTCPPDNPPQQRASRANAIAGLATPASAGALVLT